MSAPAPREPGVKYETKVLNLIVQDRDGKRKYERMLKDGWEVENVLKRSYFRGGTYTFRRPVDSDNLDKFMAASDKGLAAMDKFSAKLDSWNKKMEEKAARDKAERQLKKEERKAAKRVAKEERKRG